MNPTADMPPPSVEHSSTASKPSTARLMKCLTEAEWSDLLSEFADASFYQTWAYGAVSWGEHQLHHHVLREDGRVLGLAQVRLAKLPMLKVGVAYVRWGPCCHRRGEGWNPVTFRRLLQGLVDEYCDRGGYLLRLLPHVFAHDAHAATAIECLHQLGFRKEDTIPAYRTIRVNLSPEIEIIRKGFDAKWRNKLNGAERNRLTVTEGTGDELYRQFLKLYAEMMDRKQFDTTVDVETFRRIQQALPESQKMLIMISYREGRPQTALISTAVGQTGIYLLGATSNEGLQSKGSYLLQWRMMARLKERGCTSYDLGGINPQANPGVFEFKKGFGGDESLQLGRFVRHGRLTSSLVVTFAEKIRRLLSR